MSYIDYNKDSQSSSNSNIGPITVTTTTSTRKTVQVHVNNPSAIGPTDITGMQLWLDASDMDTLYQDSGMTTPVESSSDPIGGWSDKSGNGFHAVQSTEAYRPTYQDSVQNGLSIARLNGNNQFLSITNGSSLVIDDTCTIFIVHRSSSSDRQTLIGCDNLANGFQADISGTDRRALVNGHNVCGTYIALPSEFEILTYARSGSGVGTSFWSSNGKWYLPYIGGDYSYSADGTKEIGRRADGTQMYAGDIAEILIYSGILSTYQRYQIEAYLSEKWLITLTYIPNFSLIHISDTQGVAFAAQSTVLASSTHGKYAPIAAILSTGDLCNGITEETWAVANAGIAPLEAANVPFISAEGNHDEEGELEDRAMVAWNAHIPQSRYTEKSWWNGDFYESGHSENLYWLFSAGGQDFIIICLEYGPRQGVIDWANGLLTTYASRRAIIITHSYLYRDGTRVTTGDEFNPHDAFGAHPLCHDGEEMWNELVSIHSNIILVLCGHDAVTVARAVSIGSHGNRVNEVLFDWHIVANCVRIMEFDTLAKTIGVRTCNPATNYSELSADNTFILSYD